MASAQHQQQSQRLFEAIAANDHEALLQLYGQAAVNALIQYPSLLQRNGGTDTARGACVRCLLAFFARLEVRHTFVGTIWPNFLFEPLFHLRHGCLKRSKCKSISYDL